jgi:hypothetical protein
MPKTTPEQNDTLVLEAFETLFNTLDYTAAERFWSPKYIQHSAHKAPGRDGLFALIRSAPQTLRYENQLIVAEGDHNMATGASAKSEGPQPGSPPTLSGSKTVFLRSAGMCFRTRAHKRSPSAAYLCLVTGSLVTIQVHRGFSG